MVEDGVSIIDEQDILHPDRLVAVIAADVYLTT